MNYDLTITAGYDFTKAFTITESGVAKNLTGYTATMTFANNEGELSATEFSTTNGKIVSGGTNGILTLSITPADILAIDGNFYNLTIDDGITQTEVLSGNVFILSNTRSGVEYLIPQLRLHIGDTDPQTYRYMDEWLEVALISAIKALMRWWGYRYIVNDDYSIERNPDTDFTFEAPPIIQQQDERPIILMASILVKSGQLESNSWTVGSWRDAEIAVSNIEGSRSKQFGLNLDWQELLMYLKSPQKQLFGGVRTDLPQDNLWYN